jgi:ferredoxin-NADP reductase/ferredoxin
MLQAAERPLVLLSAGIGVTPVLAMLYSLVAARSTREVVWLYAARDGDHHPFAAEVSRLVQTLARGRSYVCYSRPRPSDAVGVNFDAIGHLSRSVFDEMRIPQEAEVYLCGPNRFMSEMKEALRGSGVGPALIHAEIFNGGESMTPGVVPTARRAPHLPSGETNSGARVSFARSGIAAHWDASAYGSILELAEACDVPVRWSCRAGVCHNCESGLVSGSVGYEPEPLDQPAEGNLLICCSRPTGDVVVDL